MSYFCYRSIRGIICSFPLAPSKLNIPVCGIWHLALLILHLFCTLSHVTFNIILSKVWQILCCFYPLQRKSCNFEYTSGLVMDGSGSWKISNIENMKNYLRKTMSGVFILKN